MAKQPQPMLFFASIMEVHVKASRGGVLYYVGDINKVQLKLANGAQAVDTFGGDNKQGGLSGFSKGSVHTIVTFDSFTRVEQADLEFDWITAVSDQTLLTIIGRIVGDTSGRRRRYEGMPTNLDEDFGLGKPNMNQIGVHCGRPTLTR